MSPGSRWESVHICSQCGFVINLDQIDLMAATTGIAVCPSCDRSGQINIQIIEKETPPGNDGTR